MIQWIMSINSSMHMLQYAHTHTTQAVVYSYIYIITHYIYCSIFIYILGQLVHICTMSKIQIVAQSWSLISKTWRTANYAFHNIAHKYSKVLFYSPIVMPYLVQITHPTRTKNLVSTCKIIAKIAETVYTLIPTPYNSNLTTRRILSIPQQF